MAIEILEPLVYDLIISIFGNPLLAGLFIVLMITIFGIAMGLSGEMLVLALFLGTIFIVSFYIPIQTIAMFSIMILGVFLGIYLIYKIVGR